MRFDMNAKYTILLMALSALNAFVDLVLAIWPISVVWNLQTTLRIKISFCVLMSTVGIIPCIAAIIKTLKLWHSIEGSDPLCMYCNRSTSAQVRANILKMIQLN